MRLNRPHDPRRRTSDGSAPDGSSSDGSSSDGSSSSGSAPGSTAGIDDAAEPDTTTGGIRPSRRPTPYRHRRVVLATGAAVVLAAIVLAPAANAHADQVLAHQALAQQVPAQRVLAQEVLAQAESVDAVLNNIRNWLVGILAALATVFLTLGGVRYVYGSGDPGEVEKSKQAFKAAGLGYGIAALAPLIVTVLQSIVGL
ncbi:pilin [Pseudonocardia sichuanensis]|uniref:Uncharacterized protein n=1 Tax=Pseudonocardia kunmingensis TaxID=630975 RepID=A0A543D9H2_9PSEU|nr:pilin [Pseudonocardia kunmingensis]TQM05989.1 hypothetical protein FB558_6217 [Pseudonocardia kunmingensis]